MWRMRARPLLPAIRNFVASLGIVSILTDLKLDRHQRRGPPARPIYDTEANRAEIDTYRPRNRALVRGPTSRKRWSWCRAMQQPKTCEASAGDRRRRPGALISSPTVFTICLRSNSCSARGAHRRGEPWIAMRRWRPQCACKRSGGKTRTSRTCLSGLEPEAYEVVMQPSMRWRTATAVDRRDRKPVVANLHRTAPARVSAGASGRFRSGPR